MYPGQIHRCMPCNKTVDLYHIVLGTGNPSQMFNLSELIYVKGGGATR